MDIYFLSIFDSDPIDLTKKNEKKLYINFIINILINFIFKENI